MLVVLVVPPSLDTRLSMIECIHYNYAIIETVRGNRTREQAMAPVTKSIEPIHRRHRFLEVPESAQPAP
jgi:hypothetical protein